MSSEDFVKEFKKEGYTLEEIADHLFQLGGHTYAECLLEVKKYY